MNELIISHGKHPDRLTVETLDNLSGNTEAFIVLGETDVPLIRHQIPVKNALALRDWLDKILPTKSPDLADLQKHLLEPYVPAERGDIVTVIKSADFDGAGEPHVVVSFGAGFAWRHGRSADGITQTRHLEHIEAEITLARKGPDSMVVTQVVPVWALRPWSDPAAKSGARCNGNPESAAA